MNKFLRKYAYGGDVKGDGSSWYDLSRVYWPTIEDGAWVDYDIHNDKEYLREIVKDPDLSENLRGLRQAVKAYATPTGMATDIDGNPIIATILSKQPYNKGDNIHSSEWSKLMRQAINKKDYKAIRDLADYQYVWYGTDKAKDIPKGIELAAAKAARRACLLDKLRSLFR